LNRLDLGQYLWQQTQLVQSGQVCRGAWSSQDAHKFVTGSLSSGARKQSGIAPDPANRLRFDSKAQFRNQPNRSQRTEWIVTESALASGAHLAICQILLPAQGVQIPATWINGNGIHGKVAGAQVSNPITPPATGEIDVKPLPGVTDNGACGVALGIQRNQGAPKSTADRGCQFGCVAIHDKVQIVELATQQSIANRAAHQKCIRPLCLDESPKSTQQWKAVPVIHGHKAQLGRFFGPRDLSRRASRV
jgi:hypothetical protein